MKFVVVGLVLAAVGASASQAQMTGMDCRRVGDRVSCEEDMISKSERINRENMERMRQRKAESRAQQPTEAELAAERTRKLQQVVAAAVKAGRCEEAKQIALDAGDLDIADKAVRLCTPTS